MQGLGLPIAALAVGSSSPGMSKEQMRERVWDLGITCRSYSHTTSYALAPLCDDNRIEVIGFFNTLVSMSGSSC